MVHLSYRERAYQLIMEKLVNNEFSAGDKIREDLLAVEFQMSRTPVREAINRLTAAGLVTDIPRRGVFAADFSKNDLLEMIKVRESLEILAVSECIDHISQEELSELRSLLSDFKRAQELNDIKEQNRLDSLFHKSIARFSGNKKLIAYISELEDSMRIARASQNNHVVQNNKERSYQQHLNIYHAIEEKDKTAAINAVKINIHGMIEKLQLKSTN